MKTLKKVLAVVLALAMVLGMAVTASATFKDAEKVNYKEAVEVMSLAGVINGFPDGTFKPEGTLTRAQAAKMIVYALGLEDTSLGYKANFGDINGHWAETPISVAAGLDIVAGMGNGQFVPDGTLTGFQWAKIILCAMGYDAEIEGMLGAGWEAKVAKLMKATGMDDDLAKFDGSKAVTREEAAQMLFNVLDEGFVGYPEAAQKAVKLGSNYYSGKKAKFGEETDFATKLGLKKNPKGADDKADKFGRPGNTWYVNYNKKDEAKVFVGDEATAVYTVATKQCDIYDELGLDGKETFTKVVNGAKEVAAEKVEDKDADYGLTAQGRLVAFYNVTPADAKESSYKVVVIDTYLAQVTKVTEVKLDKNEHVTKKAKITLDVFGEDDFYLEAKKNFDYEKDDYVLVNVNANKPNENSVILGLADVLEGKLTSVTKKVNKDATAYGVDGEDIKLACTYYGGKFTSANEVKYNFYLDQYGNILWQEVVDAVEDYYVIDSAWTAVGADGKYSYKANIVDLDGNMETVDLDDNKIGNATVKHEAADMSDALRKLTDNEDGTFTVGAVADTAKGTKVSVSNGKKYISGLDATTEDLLTAETKFLFQIDEFDNPDDGKYEAYVGYENVPSFEADATDVWYVADSTTGEIEAVYVEGATFLGAKSYVYVKDASFVKSTGKTPVYDYNVYADSNFEDKVTVQATKITTAANLFGDETGVFEIVKDADGYVIEATRLDGTDKIANDVEDLLYDDEAGSKITLNTAKNTVYWNGKAIDLGSVVFYDADLKEITAPMTYLKAGRGTVITDEDDDYYGKKYTTAWAYGPYTEKDEDFEVTAVILTIADEKPVVTLTTNVNLNATVKVDGVVVTPVNNTVTVNYGAKVEVAYTVKNAAAYSLAATDVTKTVASVIANQTITSATPTAIEYPVTVKEAAGLVVDQDSDTTRTVVDSAIVKVSADEGYRLPDGCTGTITVDPGTSAYEVVVTPVKQIKLYTAETPANYKVTYNGVEITTAAKWFDPSKDATLVITPATGYYLTGATANDTEVLNIVGNKVNNLIGFDADTQLNIAVSPATAIYTSDIDRTTVIGFTYNEFVNGMPKNANEQTIAASKKNYLTQDGVIMFPYIAEESGSYTMVWTKTPELDNSEKMVLRGEQPHVELYETSGVKNANTYNTFAYTFGGGNKLSNGTYEYQIMFGDKIVKYGTFTWNNAE